MNRAWPVSFGHDGISSDRFPVRSLRNIKCFPSYEHCAPYKAHIPEDAAVTPHHYWCYLGEVVADSSDTARTVVTSEDKSGQRIKVEFHFDDMAEFDYESIKWDRRSRFYTPNSIFFEDGNPGLHLEHPMFVKIFPCGLETLLRISDDIESETPDNCAQRCKTCGKEDTPDRITLQRCSQCLGASYCGQECQTNAGHDRECDIFKAVVHLQRSRPWDSFRANVVNKWIGFGERDPDVEEIDRQRADTGDHFQPAWNNATPAVVEKLRNSFTITSGEMIWGQLASLLAGMMTSTHDAPTPGIDNVLPPGGGTVMIQGYTYRVPAKVGEWKIVKVNGYGYADRSFDSYLVYHSSQSPIELLRHARPVIWQTRLETPRVCWVNRYDWGMHRSNELRAARLFAQVDPGAGWGAAVERRKRLAEAGKIQTNEGHPDDKKWKRLGEFAWHNIFLVDAAHAPSLVKVLARPAKLDEHLQEEQSSSFFVSESARQPFGCNLKFLGGEQEWEFARLIFGEEDSTVFPGEKELVGFWYDQDNRYHEDAEYNERPLEDPLLESL